MRLMVLALMLLAACNMPQDSSKKKVAGNDIAFSANDDIGTWSATVGPNKDKVEIVVSGNIELAKPQAKVLLVRAKDKEQKPGELTLQLTKKPVKADRYSVNVSYSEELNDAKQYSSVRIIYHNNMSVAMISHIDAPDEATGK